MLHDFRHAVRLLLRSPSFSAVAILSLAMGIGANSAMFSFVYAVLLKPLPYNQPERLVVLHEFAAGRPDLIEKVSLANYLDWKPQSRFAGTAGYAYNYASAENLIGLGASERVRTPAVTPGFFALLGVTPALGRELEADRSVRSPVAPREAVVLLSHEFWLRKFGGDPNVIGSVIALGDRRHTVVGVLPEGFRFGEEVEVWRQFDPELALTSSSRTNRAWSIVARLAPDDTIVGAQADMNAIAARLAREYPRENAGRGIGIVPLQTTVSGSARPALAVLYVSVCVVLLIACANVAGLLLARLAARQREVSVRVALGANRWRIARQLLAESLLLAAPAAALGLLLATWLVDAMIGIAPADLPRLDEVKIDGGIVAFTTLISIGSAIMFGLAPMLQAWRLDAAMALSGGRSVTRATTRARGALLVGQVALSLVLLASAGLLLRSYQRLGRVDPGFTASGVATIELATQTQHYFDDWNRVVAFHDRILSEMATIPGVEDVAITSLAPLAEGQFDDRIARADRPTEEIRSEYRFVSASYFSTLRVPRLRGRDFSRADARDAASVVILGQSTAARLFGSDDPLGQQIILRGRRRAEVVGIVADTHLVALNATPPLQVYIPFPQADIVFWTGLDVLIRSVDSGAILPTARQRLLEIDATIPPYNARTMETLVARALAPTRMWASMLTAFALLAVVLACVGLYGLLSSVVVQRARELAIRLALGATSAGLATLVLRDMGRILGAGLILGMATAAASSRALRSLLFEVSPTDWVTFGAVALVLVAVGVAASLAPIRRAMRVDPATALRVE